MDFREIFSFTRQERRGITVFTFCAAVIIIITKFWPESPKQNDFRPEDYYFPEDSLSVEKENDHDDHVFSNGFIHDYHTAGKAEKEFLTFKFDPNKISFDSLLLLGFNKFGATSLRNYLAKGGKIKNIAKFKTIYGIDSNLVDKLEDFIYFPKEVKEDTAAHLKRTPKNGYAAVKPVPFEINSADSLQWIELKGIGPYTAHKILKYRRKLGGYLYKEQIIEAGLLKDSLYKVFEPLFLVNTELIQKININTADYRTFIKHPYFTHEITTGILKYRKQHGNFADVSHIRRIITLKEETGKKIMPYLTIE